MRVLAGFFPEIESLGFLKFRKLIFMTHIWTVLSLFFFWPLCPLPSVYGLISLTWQMVLALRVSSAAHYFERFFVWTQEKGVPKNNETNLKWKGLGGNKGIHLAPEKKNIWEEKLVDPLIHNITHIRPRLGPRSDPALELHSRAASSVGVMYRSSGPNTGSNPGEGRILKKK